MIEVKGNYPINEILSFREIGYVEVILNELRSALDSNWDIYLYFALSKWKGNDLQIEPNSNRKMVLCLGDESMQTDYSFLKNVDLVFRAYLPENKRGKIYHLPVGPSLHFTPGAIIPLAERTKNVFFSGNLHRGRADLYRALIRVPKVPLKALSYLSKLVVNKFDTAFPESMIRFSSGFHNGIAPSDYARILGDSKIVLCPPGIESAESMRHFEAASLGCVIISESMPNVAVYQNAPFVILKSWNDLRLTVQKLLNDPERLLDLHHQTLDWWRSTSSPTAVANRIIQLT